MKNEINGKLIPNKNIGKSYQFINNQIKLCFYLIIFNFVFTNISCYKTIRIEGSGLCIIDKKYRLLSRDDITNANVGCGTSFITGFTEAQNKEGKEDFVDC